MPSGSHDKRSVENACYIWIHTVKDHVVSYDTNQHYTKTFTTVPHHNIFTIIIQTLPKMSATNIAWLIQARIVLISDTISITSLNWCEIEPWDNFNIDMYVNSFHWYYMTSDNTVILQVSLEDFILLLQALTGQCFHTGNDVNHESDLLSYDILEDDLIPTSILQSSMLRSILNRFNSVIWRHMTDSWYIFSSK